MFDELLGFTLFFFTLDGLTQDLVMQYVLLILKNHFTIIIFFLHNHLKPK